MDFDLFIVERLLGAVAAGSRGWMKVLRWCARLSGVCCGSSHTRSIRKANIWGENVPRRGHRDVFPASICILSRNRCCNRPTVCGSSPGSRRKASRHKQTPMRGGKHKINFQSRHSAATEKNASLHFRPVARIGFETKRAPNVPRISINFALR